MSNIFFFRNLVLQPIFYLTVSDKFEVRGTLKEFNQGKWEKKQYNNTTRNEMKTRIEPTKNVFVW